ncbi:hypothetical protein SARC_06975 [Sphaeroforma arctica JP610]|uniref:Uncharacterized protein n=1 Tax=Sphaeroforma arctica JP610 TaxID=667725 RepID=A0A0L0FVT6_9EUKA|nr:hypothetical protein SARC_06975 [Sphaeroforma arctica JP610]KNC80661.1 hypothetical protein SARC_06975 [Sphaeroforma arctica JP610]|eukprot:XP_014154563.1 hypothetical protein SARC_06975 [Sphaeroforma arctica JP610]
MKDGANTGRSRCVGRDHWVAMELHRKINDLTRPLIWEENNKFVKTVLLVEQSGNSMGKPKYIDAHPGCIGNNPNLAFVDERHFGVRNARTRKNIGGLLDATMHRITSIGITALASITRTNGIYTMN